MHSTVLQSKCKDCVKLFFAGDVVLLDRTYKGKKMVNSDLFSFISNHDIVCCNLEGPIKKEGIESMPKRGAVLNNGILSSSRLRECGFNMLTLANNHIMDYGMEGLVYSLEMLEKDFYCIGAGKDIDSVYQLQKICIGDVTIGFIAVGESQFGVCKEDGGGYAWMLSRNLLRIFQHANEECKYYFVICHCGAEELEVPLPEVRELYKTYIDLGATAVIGHHPHVIQGYEEYRERKIFYSLGNFAFDLKDQELPYNPIGLCLSIEIRAEGVKFFPIITEYKDGEVIVNEDADNLVKATRMLNSDNEYKELVEEYCVDTYKNIFRKYYALIVGMDIENRENLIKFVHHRLNNDEIVWDDLFVYHNIAIETCRWVCERAIRLSVLQ